MAEKAAKLNELALGYAGAIITAAIMLLLGIFGPMGIYGGAAQMMQEAHMFFSLSIIGVVTGMIEAAIMGFVFGYVLALLYNKFA